MKLGTLMNLLLIVMFLQKHIDFCQGSIAVSMHQVEEGRRVVGSDVTVISNISGGSSGGQYIEVKLFGSDPSGSSELSRLALYFFVWETKEPVISSLSDQKLQYLTLSAVVHSDRTRQISWQFSYLPERYDGLNLTTKVSSRAKTYEESVILRVSYCKSPVTLKTTGQNSSFRIIAESNSSKFEDKGTCECHENEVLHNLNGASDAAICGLHAEWVGCENVQCWSGPQEVRAEQVDRTVNATNPFNCLFSGGFPPPSKFVYKIDNETVDDNYVLQSLDHGKELTCRFISDYTENEPDESQEDYISPPEMIVVFYPPERASFSNASPYIRLNEPVLLNYTFFVNARDGNVTITIEDKFLPGSFQWTNNYTDNVHHIYQFVVTVTSTQNFAIHRFCSSTMDPVGRSCANLDIRHAPVTDTPTFTVTTYLEKLLSENLYLIIIGLSIAGLLVIVILVVWCKKRKKNKNQDPGIHWEERLNELYDSVANQTETSAARPERVRQERYDKYMYVVVDI